MTPPPGEYEDDYVRDVRDYASLVVTTSMQLDIDPNKNNDSRNLTLLIESVQELIRRSKC